MKQYFKTKRDINGNTYYLTIDHTNREISRHDLWWNRPGNIITITRKEMRILISDSYKAGYKEKE